MSVCVYDIFFKSLYLELKFNLAILGTKFCNNISRVVKFKIQILVLVALFTARLITQLEIKSHGYHFTRHFLNEVELILFFNYHFFCSLSSHPASQALKMKIQL